MQIPVAKEVFKYIVVLIPFAIAFLFVLPILSVIFAILILGFLYFFRDPERVVIEEAKRVVSPADGKVISIREVFEGNFLNCKANCITIFLSIFDVHINRSPIEGEVAYLKYTKGRFFNALRDKASTFNENNFVGIRNGSIELGVRQIAGAIARRVICPLHLGESLKAGQRMGMIEFGSRVEVYLPPHVKINVARGEKVKAGKTVIGDIV